MGSYIICTSDCAIKIKPACMKSNIAFSWYFYFFFLLLFFLLRLKYRMRRTFDQTTFNTLQKKSARRQNRVRCTCMCRIRSNLLYKLPCKIWFNWIKKISIRCIEMYYFNTSSINNNINLFIIYWTKLIANRPDNLTIKNKYETFYTLYGWFFR